MYRLTLLVVALTIFIALPLQGQMHKLYLPALQATDTADLGIALVNPTLADAQVTFTARSYSGAAIQNGDITNPVTLDLPASRQIALRAVEIFGSGISSQTGWVELSASTPAVRGCFLIFDSGLSFIDGSKISSTASGRLIFPNVSTAAAFPTRVSLINTAPVAIDGIISLYENSGRLAATEVFRLPALGGYTGTVNDLVPSSAGFEGYLVAEAQTNPGSERPESLVGFEIYRNRSDVALIGAFPDAARLRTGYLAHFASGGGYATTLTLANYGGYSQVVRITAQALESNGQTYSPASVGVERIISPNGRLNESVDQMFKLPVSSLITGNIRYETQEDTPGVFGYLDYGTTDGVVLSAVEAQGEGYSDILFSQVAEGFDYYTGVALLNSNTQPTTVTLDMFDSAGRRTDSTVLTLRAGERKARLLSEWFQSEVNQLGGYIHISSSRPIYAFELFGSRTSSGFLADVPAQGVNLIPQSSGRIVSASRGADVISEDSATSILVPAGALTADTSIRVTRVVAADFQRPSANQRPVSVVEATPVGTRFQVPVRIDFPLEVGLPPGERIPLLAFSRQTNQYETTRFFAVADPSGRIASAEVTELTTFVAALPDDRLVPVVSIAPSSGQAGTIVEVIGNGFNADAADDNVVTFAGANNTTVPAQVLAATSTSLSVVVPAGAVTGLVMVQVGSKSSIGMTFTLPGVNPQPAIASISPWTTPVVVSFLQVQIPGTGFQPNSMVTYDGIPLAFSFIDSTLLSVTVQSPQPGVHHMVVVNPPPGGGSSNAAEFIVAFPAPVISSINPNRADIGRPVEVFITGSGFTPQSTVRMDGQTQNTTLVNPNTVKATLISTSAGRRLISVLNPLPAAGLSNTGAFQFTVPNTPPVVHAGLPQTITLPAVAALSGTAADDGLPLGSTLMVSWIKVSGPGTVTFENLNSLSTTAGFSAAGTYLLRLTATDGAFTASDEVTIVVKPSTFTGIGDTEDYPPPASGVYAYSTFKPSQPGFLALGQTYVDPVFGSVIRRITNDYPNQSFSDIYSKNGWWNADGTRFIHKTASAHLLIDPKSGAIVRRGIPAGAGKVVGDASFDPVDPDIWYYYNEAELRQYSLKSGVSTIVKTFPASLTTLGGSVDWIDRTGRYFVVGYNGAARVWDKQTDTMYSGSVNISSLDGGWIGITPSGNYLVVTGSGGQKFSYAINHTTRSISSTATMFWSLCGGHGDLVSPSDEKDYFVTFECDAIAAIYRVDITLAQSTSDRNKQRADNVRLFDLDWADDDGHHSCAAKGLYEDWCYVSTESNDDTFADTGKWRPGKQEIIMVQVVPPFAVRRLAHHRSRQLDCRSCTYEGYFHEPRLSVSWDGTKIAWASNFGYNATPAEYADIYVLELSDLAQSAQPLTGTALLATAKASDARIGLVWRSRPPVLGPISRRKAIRRQRSK